MCVIIVAESQRPSRKILEAGWRENPHGAGIAWLDKGKVRYVKGERADAEVMKLAATVPLPFVVHFRIASSGQVCDDLCHPFPFGGGKEGQLRGTTDGVVFHNGTWADWKPTLLHDITSSSAKMPGGPWNDSRAMSFLAGRHGAEVLNLIPESQRVVAFTSKQLLRFGARWVKLVDGLYASNDNFLRGSRPFESGQLFYELPPAREIVDFEEEQLPLMDDEGLCSTCGGPMGADGHCVTEECPAHPEQ